MESLGVIQKALPEGNQLLSNIFLRPKRDGKQRPIINLKELNGHIPYQHFQMEGLRDLKHLLRPGDLMIKLDLKNAYWSVPINKNHRKFMRFQWKGQLWEFLVLAFGLGPAPRTFTKLLKIPVGTLRRLMIRVIIYLDDMLLIASNMEEILRSRDSAIFLFENLGFTINYGKSVLTPCHRCEFLGMMIDSKEMTINLPEGKINEISLLCQTYWETPVTKLTELASLIGKLYATLPAISQAPIQLRYLQQDLINAQREGLSFRAKITLSPQGRSELKWWIHNLHLVRGTPIRLKPPDMTILTDASSTIGWGLK